MKTVRCAIYTRKSSDEGLEQDFNSLDAQREACAAYILSQASEGWELVPTHYDDGGISGGTLERPALQQLLADIAAAKIDIVVLYKIDRLTRSLLDFAKLVEAFESAGTSFVSVTQSFNTTTSMGRLTLNMLLSFAQFEREVTAERIRDKLAASKAKGMWMGGIPPIGYRQDGRSLRIVEHDAALIRDIYARYQALGNVRLVTDQLAGEAVTSPVRKLATGRVIGGRPFSRGQVYAVLRNPVYAGRIAHGERSYPGLHRAIIAPETWDAVQQQLAGHIKGARGSRRVTRSLLAGVLFDASGEAMLASHTTRRGQRYRYYVSRSLHLGQGDKAGTGIRVPATEIEAAVAGELAALLDDPLALAERARLVLAPASLKPFIAQCAVLAGRLREDGLQGLHHLAARVDIREERIDLAVSTRAISDAAAVPLAALAPAAITLPRDVQLARTGQVVRFIQGNGAGITGSEPDPALARLILQSRKWWAVLRHGRVGPRELAAKEGVSPSYVSRVARLAFLAPEVVEAVLAGKLRPGVGSGTLLRHDAIPDDWDEQVRLFVAA